MYKIEQLKLSDLKNRTEKYDVFLCSSSFEERCMSVAKSINRDSMSRVLICHYYGTNHKSNENFASLSKMFADNYKEIKLQKSEPLSNYDALFSALVETKCESVLFDISTFTRETLLIALMLFKQNSFSSVKLQLCYTPAVRYSAQDDDQSKCWLSKGVQEIRSVIGYPGFFSSLKKTMMIVLVGLEAERAKILIENYEPDKLLLGFAPEDKSLNKKIAKANRSCFEELSQNVGDYGTFNFSCIDVNQTVDTLNQIVEKNQNTYNIVISAMNNKLSIIAVSEVALTHPEVQICYASTNQYNTDGYSYTEDKVYLIS
jgi:hypothetical protein